MKIPLSLPPTKVMSFKRLSPSSDTSCTGLTDELTLEKEDRDGRNGLHIPKNSVRVDSGMYIRGTPEDFRACEHMSGGAVPLQ